MKKNETHVVDHSPKPHRFLQCSPGNSHASGSSANCQSTQKESMSKRQEQNPNTFFVEVSGSGLPEVDGLFVPSTAPPTTSESNVVSSPGYWNGKMAWDRADGRGARSPSLSYSNTYRSWRISRLDGHLAYHVTSDDEMPPTDREWETYKMGVAPAPRIVLHHRDPRLPRHKPHVIFVLGGPGAGKGTMCDLAALQLGWTHLSAGALLRQERESGGPNAAIIEAIVTAGKLVPDQITVGLLKNAMDNIAQTTGRNRFLVDGFPRSLSNLEAWNAVFGQESELPVMVYFECPYPVLEQRVLRRAKHTGRLDDNVESTKLRFDTFRAETLPIVELFKSKGRCIEIDTSQDREAVYSLFSRVLEERAGE